MADTADRTADGADEDGEARAAGDAPSSKSASSSDRSRARGRFTRSRHVPFLPFFGYYLVLIVITTAAVIWIPAARDFFLAPLELGGMPADGGLLTGEPEVGQRTAALESAMQVLHRSLTTVFIALGAIVLSVPVAWVYMFTRRLRYDRSLVHAIIILPMVVAAVVMVVKNSLALAFALAGIVAAVRWRTTVKDPKDAVYIFLMMGLGLAAGVQALDIALVASLGFNTLILLLWKYDIGAIYTPGSTESDFLSVGDAKLFVAQDQEDRDEIRDEMYELSHGIKTHGVLLVHAVDPDMARRAVEITLQDAIAKDWRFVDVVEDDEGLAMLRVLVRVRKKSSPLELLGELEDRWSGHIAAAEYIPFKTKKKTK